MFGIGPAYLFMLQHRLPVGLMRGNGWTPWISTMATNLAIAAIAATLIWFIGLGRSCSCTCRSRCSRARSGCGCSTCSTSSKAPLWDARRRMGPPRGGAARQLALRPAGAAALVHGQYRRAPCSPSGQRHSLLPSAARAARPSGIARHQPGDADAELPLRRLALWCEARRRAGELSRRQGESRIGPPGGSARRADRRRALRNRSGASL